MRAARSPSLQPRHRRRLRRPAPRHELRPQGLPRASRPRAAALRRAAPLHAGARLPARLPHRRDAGQPPPAAHGRSRYGFERYLRGFFDLLTVSFIGRYRHRPLHLFGGLGLLTILGGGACLIYLTFLKAQGHAIGSRPLLTLGVLLVVVGIQLLSIGLIGEMITSLHEERADERSRSQAVVDEVLTRS